MKRWKVFDSFCGLLVLLAAFGGAARCQETRGEVKKVEVHGREVTIVYDLKGSADQQFIIRVFLYSSRHPDQMRELETARGDIGEGKYAGTGHRIYWNMNEFPDIPEGEGFIFRMIVETPGIPWYYWAGGGAAVAGGVALIVLKGKSDGTHIPPPPAVIPTPPSR
jgi:hypothetical protein